MRGRSSNFKFQTPPFVHLSFIISPLFLRHSAAIPTQAIFLTAIDNELDTDLGRVNLGLSVYFLHPRVPGVSSCRVRMSGVRHFASISPSAQDCATLSSAPDMKYLGKGRGRGGLTLVSADLFRFEVFLRLGCETSSQVLIFLLSSSCWAPCGCAGYPNLFPTLARSHLW